MTIRGDTNSTSPVVTISSVYFDNARPIDHISFRDIVFRGQEAQYFDYDTAIITSSTRYPGRVGSLEIENSVFTAANLPAPLYSRNTAIWAPILNESLSIAGSTCTGIRFLISTSSREPVLSADGPKFLSISNTSFSSVGCVVDLKSSQRLTRESAKISGCSLSAAARKPSDPRDCHTTQGFKRVDIIKNDFHIPQQDISIWRNFLCFHLKAARYVIAENDLVRQSPETFGFIHN